MSVQEVIIMLAPDYKSRLPEVVQRLQALGLNVEQQLELTGVITGSIDPDRRSDLERVEGVAHVEVSHVVQLPPPDHELQ